MCLIDRSIPFLIVRLKNLFVVVSIVLSCLSCLVIFHYPKLNYEICRTTIDLEKNSDCSSKMTEIDVSFYVGTNWQKPTENFIPSEEFPQIDYNLESKMSSRASNSETFSSVLSENLFALLDFCSSKNFSDFGENFFCFGDVWSKTVFSNESQSKLTSAIVKEKFFSPNCSRECSKENSIVDHRCFFCLNDFFLKLNPNDDLFLLKNGLRFIGDSELPRFLFQTVRFRIDAQQNLGQLSFWSKFFQEIEQNFFTEFYRKFSNKISFWFSAETFGNVAIIELLERDKLFLTAVKFISICLSLLCFTGFIAFFVTLTIFKNFIASVALLTLFNFHLSVENHVLFNLVLIISCQYSILFTMR